MDFYLELDVFLSYSLSKSLVVVYLLLWVSPESKRCPIIYLNSLCLECAVYVRDGGESEALVGALEDLPPGSLGGGRLAAEHRLRGRHLARARHRGTEVPGHFTPLKPQDSLAADLAFLLRVTCMYSRSGQTLYTRLISERKQAIIML